MATYKKSDLYRAIRKNCCICNDTYGGWNEVNDCTSVSCEFYQFRPGSGPGHKEHMPKRNNPAAVAALKASAKSRKGTTRKTILVSSFVLESKKKVKT